MPPTTVARLVRLLVISTEAMGCILCYVALVDRQVERTSESINAAQTQAFKTCDVKMQIR